MEVQPGIETQAQGSQVRKPGPKLGLVEQVLARRVRRVQQGGVRVPRHDMANSPEASTAFGWPSRDGDVGFQHRPHSMPEAQIGGPDDRSAGANGPVVSAGAHRRHIVGEFGFSNGLESLVAVLAQHGTRLHIDGRPHVVPRPEIGQQLIEQIPYSGPVVEVVVGIDDGLARVQHVLLRRDGLARWAHAVGTLAGNCGS